MKKFFEEYGGVTLGICAVLVLIAMVSPVGAKVKDSLTGIVNGFSESLTEGFDGATGGSADESSGGAGGSEKGESSGSKIEIPVIANYVATLNDTNYTSLNDAIAAANANDTITLLKDVTIEIKKPSNDNIPINIEAKGNTLTLTNTYENSATGFAVNVINFSNGVLKCNDKTYTASERNLMIMFDLYSNSIFKIEYENPNK